MALRFSLPFKTIVGNEVVLGKWHYRIGGGDWLRVEETIVGWDYLAQLEFRRAIEVDGERARAACGLDPDVPIDLVVTAHSAPARFRRVVFRTNVPAHRWSDFVAFQVPSAEIAEQLRLDTELILMRTLSSNKKFTARYLGSRLSTDGALIDLEGTRSRMPLELASFERQLPWLNAPRAPWHVDCGSRDLHAPVMRDLRVYLNADQPSFTEAAQRGDETVVTLLRAEIARRILETALDDQTFVAGFTDLGEGTLGEAATRILRLCFDDMTPTDVLALAKRDAGSFEAKIRSRFNHHNA